MAHSPRPPSFTSDAVAEARSRSSARPLWVPSSITETQPDSQSGIWRLGWRGSRSQAAARCARGPRLRDVLVWSLTVLFVCGAVTLCAITLVEIAQRLLELGGVNAQPPASD